MFRFVLGALAALLSVITDLDGAHAHFAPGTQLQTIILGQTSSGHVSYVEIPLALVFSDVVVDANVNAAAPPSPFLYAKPDMDGQLKYWLSLEAVAANQAAFSERVLQALVFSRSGQDLPVTLRRMRFQGAAAIDRFSDVAAAEQTLSAPSVGSDPEFGRAVLYLDLAIDGDVGGIWTVRAGYPTFPMPAGTEVDTIIIDARQSPPVSYTRPGQITEALQFKSSFGAVAREYIWQGALHILKGLDHVFLVVAMTLGALSTARLFGLVTAFTIGHSVTLIAGFLGVTPSWPWFIPAIEALIAATVVYAALSAGLKRQGKILVFAAIGLLHGLGFSFVLGDVLGRESPDLIPALATFNIGIELGQIAVVCLVLLATAALKRISEQALFYGRMATLGVIGLVSTYWLVERALSLA